MLGLNFNTPLNKAFLLFFISAIISTILSINPYHSQRILFNRFFPYLFCFYAGFNFLRDEWDVRFFTFSFLISGIIVGLGGLVHYSKHLLERLFFSWNVNMDIGIFATLFLPFSFIYLIRKENLKMKIFIYTGFCLMAICLLLNYSRGCWVSIILGITAILLISKKKIGFFSLFIFVAISLIFFFIYNADRITNIETWGVRIPYIIEGLKLFKHSPLIGKGLGTFELQQLFSPLGTTKILHVENLYVEILAQSGIIGLCVFFYLFWVYFKQVISRIESLKTYQIAISASILSSLISGLFGSVIIVGVSMPFLFWFLLGISMSEINPGRNDSPTG